jgi:hypothetical protein
MIQGVESVTIVRKTTTGTDEYGLPVTTTQQIVVPRVLVGFGSTEEPVSAFEDPQAERVTLYFEQGTVIQQQDEFIVRGEKFVKDGRHNDWLTPFSGFFPGVVVYVRAHRG